MTSLAICPIVEGHGDAMAVPLLLRRIASELGGGAFLEVIKPVRVPRSKLVQQPDMLRAIDLAHLKLAAAAAERRCVLILFDADEAAACELGPQLVTIARERRAHVDVAVVLPVPEYETWFVAAAESLERYLRLDGVEIPRQPEQQRAKKAWLQRHFNGRYAETIEQPALTAMMELALCRSRSPSFDKLCREVASRLPPAV